MTEAEPTRSDAPILDPIEARVLGCLVEKAATTPEVYPLILNAVVAACNQKSNRDPLLDLEPGAVGHALRQLEGKRFVAGSMSARASRYEHRMDQALNITPRQRALLALLMLRGPQTAPELLTRSDRLADFPGLDDVRATLAGVDDPVVRTGPGPPQPRGARRVLRGHEAVRGDQLRRAAVGGGADGIAGRAADRRPGDLPDVPGGPGPGRRRSPGGSAQASRFGRLIFISSMSVTVARRPR